MNIAAMRDTDSGHRAACIARPPAPRSRRRPWVPISASAARWASASGRPCRWRRSAAGRDTALPRRGPGAAAVAAADGRCVLTMLRLAAVRRARGTEGSCTVVRCPGAARKRQPVIFVDSGGRISQREKHFGYGFAGARGHFAMMAGAGSATLVGPPPAEMQNYTVHSGGGGGAGAVQCRGECRAKGQADKRTSGQADKRTSACKRHGGRALQCPDPSRTRSEQRPFDLREGVGDGRDVDSAPQLPFDLRA